MQDNPIIRVENITKYFTSTRALHNVSLEVKPGEIRGLIGENGSGKSTLSSIISGNLKKDGGEMFFMGEPYLPRDSFDASEHGVAMIVQEQGTIETITVGANIFAGREKRFVTGGFLNSQKLNAEAKKLLLSIGVDNISPETLAGALSFEDRKLVEIARAFYKTPELFIVDETTTALPQKGRNILYSLINKLKEQNKSVLFISHDIEELIRVCDTVTILRDGELIATLGGEEMEESHMKALMVGREIGEHYYRDDYEATCAEGAPALTVENVSGGLLKDINFTLKRGEILGFAGLSDCGMHDLCKMIFGLQPTETGSIKLEDGYEIHNPQQAIRHRVAFMSKNRDSESMLITMSIQENTVLPSLPHLQKLGFFITPRSEKKLAEEWCTKLNVKMRDLKQACTELSGGNKQKIVLAKWLANGSDIFILDCPTRGIDVGVKEAIYRIMEELKAEGKAIIMVSEELPEVLGMCDRVLVIKDGEIKHEFTRSAELNETDVIQYMI